MVARSGHLCICTPDTPVELADGLQKPSTFNQRFWHTQSGSDVLSTACRPVENCGSAVVVELDVDDDCRAVAPVTSKAMQVPLNVTDNDGKGKMDDAMLTWVQSAARRIRVRLGKAPYTTHITIMLALPRP